MSPRQVRCCQFTSGCGKMLVRLTHLQAHLKHSVNPSRTIFTSPRRFTMRIIPVPCRSDNYAYIVIDQSSNKAAGVGPHHLPQGIEASSEAGGGIVWILTTQHHAPYLGGEKVSGQPHSY